MNRRTLLTRIVQGFSITGLGFITYPFLRAWVPSFDQDLGLEIDLSELAPGESKIVHWLGRNLHVIRRTNETIASLTTVDQPLKDPESQASAQPIFATNAYRSLRADIFVGFSNCTHLGCGVVKQDNGFKCPCHQSDYDAAGRVVEGAAAPLNLEVPNYRYISGNLLKLEPFSAEDA